MKSLHDEASEVVHWGDGGGGRNRSAPMGTRKAVTCSGWDRAGLILPSNRSENDRREGLSGDSGLGLPPRLSVLELRVALGGGSWALSFLYSMVTLRQLSAAGDDVPTVQPDDPPAFADEGCSSLARKNIRGSPEEAPRKPLRSEDACDGRTFV